MKITEILKEYESRYGEDEGRTLKNPLPHITGDDRLFGHIFDLYDDTVGEIASTLDIADNPTKWKKATSMAATTHTVPIKDIVGTEKYLDPRGAKSRDLPVLVLYEGKYYVLDGNHRVYAAHANGEKAIQASVIQVED